MDDTTKTDQPEVKIPEIDEEDPQFLAEQAAKQAAASAAAASKRQISQDKQDERETWHKLVVKVITWRDGLFEGGLIKDSDKITAKEWSTYSKGVIKINTSAKAEKIKANLDEIKQRIKQHGGFEADVPN